MLPGVGELDPEFLRSFSLLLRSMEVRCRMSEGAVEVREPKGAMLEKRIRRGAVKRKKKKKKYDISKQKEQMEERV